MAINLNVQGNTQPLEAAVQAAVNRIRKTPIKITVDDKGATQPLGNMKRGADEFSKSMEAANARIIAFGASMAIINGVSDAFKAMVKNVVEVEKALADINVVMGLSATNLDKFSSGLFKVAKETAASFDVAAAAATEYARQGLKVEETLKRTKDALILTRLTGMDSANAVKALTAAMNTYGDQIKDTTQLVSKFAAVDVQFAVSAEDFADAISRTGQAAKSAGVDIDELVGLVTAAQQQTARGGKVIGNSFKTIFTRIGRTDTLNQLENLGIAVRDVEGRTLGAKRILTDLANTFDHLSEAQKAQIAQTVGGVFQINVLKAVLSDAAKQNGILANATQISAGATDEAITKNEQLRQTMAAMASETGLALKEVSAQIGEIMLAPGMEKILNIVKSMTEGVGDMLGTGEGAGNTFAKGFLKGLGNIITGPGLVVMVAVFTKLLIKAVQYARDSLKSLIGVTSEAQKQKAIQTSLVTLFGQNAALNKEMLRTDISRTEKEKIILSLLKAQVMEANALNSLTKQMSTTLYSKGYGANLAPRKGRASGHIPNFADPERQQAAQGGYAAGSIRSMNIPGEGSVIYNSAEKVKNFKGMSQPAIMPPKSSKAGKNYQQAFGDIHGFDPYAAGGYIPNYAAYTLLKPDRDELLYGKKGDPVSASNWKQSEVDRLIESGHITKVTTTSQLKDAGQIYNKSGRMVLFAASAQGGGSYAGDRKENIIYLNPNAKKGDSKFSTTNKKGMIPVNVPYFTIGKNDEERAKNDPKIKNKIEGDLIRQSQKTTNQLVSEIFKEESIPNVIKSGDVAVTVGNVFEKILMSVQKGVSKEAYDPDPPGNALLDIPRGGRDALWNLFGATPLGSLGAEAKIALGSGSDAAHLKSAAEKFYKIDSYKGPGGKKAKAFAPAGQVQVKRGRTKASGYIPNFANPLSDAIGREKEAGVPVSQIRVGSHPALMNKGNPIGLGVTNTQDEPNGLRDVFGAANGFVPNYFNPIDKFKSSNFSMQFQRGAQELDKDFLKLSKLIKEKQKSEKKHQKTIDKLSNIQNRSQRQESDLIRARNSLVKSSNTLSKLQANSSKLQSSRNLSDRGSGPAGFLGRMSGGLGRRFSGNAGMMMMMGAPMAAGFLQQGGMGAQGGDQNMYAAGGALSGAASGAMMASMVAPFFGPAAPLVIGVGGLIGGINGWISASEENTKALKEKREQELNFQTQSASQALSQVIQGPELSKTLSSAGITRQGIQNLGLTEGNSVLEGVQASTKEVGMPESLRKLAKIFEGNKYYKDEAAIAKQVKTSTKRYPVNYGLLSKPESELTEGERKNTILMTLRKSYQYQKQSKDFMGMSQDQDAPMIGQLFEKEELMRQAQKRSRSEIIDYLMQNEKRTSFAYNFGEKKGGTGYLDKVQYANLLKGKEVDVGGKISKQTLSEEAIKAALAKESEKIQSEYINTQGEQRDALILQLNFQRVMLKSQKAAADAQLDIKSKYLKQSNLLDSQEKMLGGLMSEEQKVRIQYNKNLTKASEAYASGAAKAESDFSMGLLQDIQGQGRDSLRVAIKQELFDRMSAKEKLGKTAEGITNIELSSKLAGMLPKEREALLKSIKGHETEIQEILGNRKLIYDNQINTLKKQKTLSDGQSEAQKTLNEKIAQQKDLMVDVNREMQDYIRGLDNAAQSRAIASEITAARFGARPQTQEATFAEQQRLVKERQQGIRESYTKSAISEMQKLATDKGLTEEQRLKIAADPSELKGMSSAAIDSMSKEFQSKGGASYINTLTRDTNLRQQQLERPQTSEYKEFYKKEYKEAYRQQAEDLQKLKELKALEQSIADAKAQTSKQEDDIIAKLEEQKNKVEERISKEKILQEIREAEYARRTGPGAFKEGIKDAGIDMEKRVAMMDYELGNNIPMKFADGLAQAMQATLNQTENLGDALMGIASNFLQAIQSALLQKAAYQIVGGVGASTGLFSKGGGVRNYSRGGGVPAMVTNGEYVMGGDAVSKYGGAFMHSLNAGGKIPGYANGGAAPGSAIAENFGGGRGFASGRAYQSKAMSSFFYTQSQNVGLQEDEQSLMGVLQEEERKRQEAAAKKAKKKAFLKQLIGTALTAGLTYGMGKLGGSATGNGVTGDIGGGATVTPVSQGGSGVMRHALDLDDAALARMPLSDQIKYNTGYLSSSEAAIFGRYRGGSIRKYASGGHISGKSGIDQIPAMLSEGEYVIKASSARQIGKPMLDRINAGKYNDGGAVGSTQIDSSTSAGNTNNISISINMENGKVGAEEKTQDTNPATSQEGSSEKDQSLLAEKIKQQVVSVIVEEQRPGGLLSE